MMLPMSEESLEVIESCGFEIIAQAAFLVNYKNAEYELMIDDLFGVSVKHEGAIKIIFPKAGMPDESVLAVLHHLQVIDLKSFVKKNKQPRVLAGGNAGVFNHIKTATA